MSKGRWLASSNRYYTVKWGRNKDTDSFFSIILKIIKRKLKRIGEKLNGGGADVPQEGEDVT